MIALTEAFAGASIPAGAEEFRAQVKAFLAEKLPDRPAHVRARPNAIGSPRLSASRKGLAPR